MSRFVCRVAAFAIAIVVAQSIGAAGLSRRAPLLTGGLGFDLAGSDFAKHPGDDFFRHGNGAWYDRALIPPDRSAIGVDTVLDTLRPRPAPGTSSNEARTAPALQCARMPPRSGRSMRRSWTEARAEALDAETDRSAPAHDSAPRRRTRTLPAIMAGRPRQSFFTSRFSASVSAPDATSRRTGTWFRSAREALGCPIADDGCTAASPRRRPHTSPTATQLLAMIGWEAS